MRARAGATRATSRRRPAGACEGWGYAGEEQEAPRHACEDAGVLEVEEREGVTVVRMAHGPVSAMDDELLTALSDRFGALAEDGEGPIVLTGTRRAFSAGVDLPRIVDGGEPYVRRFFPLLAEAFLAIATCPRPVVAAVNGHALAGGCVVACATDRRLMAAGDGRIGVTELAVGVPFPVAALEIVRHVVGPRADDLVLTGRGVLPDEALRLGLVDAVVPPDELAAAAFDAARGLGRVPPATYRHTKRQLRRPMLERIAAHAAADDAAAEDAWASDDLRAAIAAFAQRTFGRGKR